MLKLKFHKVRKIFFLLCLLLSQQAIFSQSTKLKAHDFFTDDKLIEASLTTDIKNLRKEKSKPTYQPGKIVMTFADSSTLTGDVHVEPRGIYRKKNCDLAALMLNFKTPTSPLASLGRVKLVGGCRNGNYYEELLLKEYMIYKIQNLLSDMSFRVRLIHITYNDSQDKVKPISQYAFLMEDIDDLAKRNKCRQVKNKEMLTHQVDREQMTFVNIFQYMIGNTDWSIPALHNMKLIVLKTDTLARPYAIPYDFDYAGFVNAVYAVPAEGLGLESVRTRMYRGFSRGLDELTKAIVVFNEKKDTIMNYVDNFSLCSEKERKLMHGYLDDFYEIINDQGKLENIFIRNARVQ